MHHREVGIPERANLVELAEGGGSDKVGVVLHSEFKEVVGRLTVVAELGGNRGISLRPECLELLREELTLYRRKKYVLISLDLACNGAV